MRSWVERTSWGAGSTVLSGVDLVDIMCQPMLFPLPDVSMVEYSHGHEVNVLQLTFRRAEYRDRGIPGHARMGQEKNSLETLGAKQAQIESWTSGSPGALISAASLLDCVSLL